MPRKTGSPFIQSPTIIIEPAALKGLGEFKFLARDSFPREHLASLEGLLRDSKVYIEDFVHNVEYKADTKGNWLDYADEAITRAKQAAAGRHRVWLGTIHSHPYGSAEDATVNLSPSDHISGHFHAEIISAIYTIKKSGKNNRLYSPPIRFFVPQGRISVVFS